jgi:hypothetical protein
VLRPGLRRRFRADVETLALGAAAAEKVSAGARSANLTGFVELFAQLALEELDFRLEAANLVDSSAVLEAMGADEMVAPRPIPGMVTERVLVMELLPGSTRRRISTATGCCAPASAGSSRRRSSTVSSTETCTLATCWSIRRPARSRWSTSASPDV